MLERTVVVGGVIGAACGFSLKFVEKLVEILAIEDHARTLAHGHELGAPHLIERASFHSHIDHGFLMVQAALCGHGATLVLR